MNDKTNQNELKTCLSRRGLLKVGSTGLLVAAVATPMIYSTQSVYAKAADTKNKTLTVYYSRTGSTQTVAQYIHKQVGGDILKLEPATPYSSDYDTATKQVRRELLTGVRTPLRAIPIDINVYDTLLIGSPRWWGTMSVPALNFVLQHDLSGKTLLPFSTHAGGTRDMINDDLEILCPHAKLGAGLTLLASQANGSQKEIANWLRRAGIVE